MKSAEKEYTGNQTVTDGVEMAGWGVEEAEAQNRKDASMLHLFLTLSCLYTLYYDVDEIMLTRRRFGNAPRISICHT